MIKRANKTNSIGEDAGQRLSAMLLDGTIQARPGQTINTIIPLGGIKLENFSPITQLLIATGSEEGAVIGNAGIVCCGVYTGSCSYL